MNAEVLVIVVAGDGGHGEAMAAARDVERLFARVEAALSRFRPASELSRLNRAAGRPFRASPLLFAVVSAALAAARETGGLFDPTVLGALVAAGYDRSFELLAAGPDGPPPAAPPRPRCDWRDVALDERAGTIALPAGCGLDLGGIGKGWAVDRAVDRLRPRGNFVIDAGGDLYAAGAQAGGAPWTVGVADPHVPARDLLVLTPRDRAVATSTTARRRWKRGGVERHHLIDPRTGAPATSGVVSATVVAESVARAEVLAKVALLLGPRAGRAFLDRQAGVPGILVHADGRVDLSSLVSEVAR
ncbi:MAG TPA: FAD:protein FMN transferase, partial [Thermomicrobiales bacterium]|nr:FAD:protein FMN transferase [Thermomicrobiales bacterium]